MLVCPNSSRTFATLSVAMSHGQEGMLFHQQCGMQGCTTCQAVNRPTPRGFRAKVHGSDVSPRVPPRHFLIVFFGWGLQQRLGCDAPGAGRPRARPGCSAELDPFGIHAASCNWRQVCKRHDRLRDHLAVAARQAGMAVVTEQNMAIEPDVPGTVWGIRRADVRIIETDGRQLWVDVKVMTTKPKVGIKSALCQAEVAKCKQYGQGPPERSIRHGRWSKPMENLLPWLKPSSLASSLARRS